jgi:signal transduction histidine kinase/CheY-like chemotaxis protein
MKNLPVARPPHGSFPFRQVTPVVYLAVAMILAVVPRAAAAEPEVLTTARTVRVLSAEQAAERRAVRLQGVVTHANPHRGDFFICDGTAPIYVQPQADRSLTMGDRVEVAGTTSAGDFAPCVRPAAVKKLGTGPLPDPLPYDLNREDSRWLDAHWVQCWATVRDVRTQNGFTTAKLYSRSGDADLLIPGEGNVAPCKELEGAYVRLRGVCVPGFNKQRVVDRLPRIFVQGPENLVVLERAEFDPGKVPTLLIDQLLRYSPDPHPGARRVRVAGTVTGTGPRTAFYIQDATAPACVVAETPAVVTPGTKVEVVGTLVVQGAALRLEGATVRVVGSEPPPAPRRLTAEQLAAEQYPYALVTLSGRVLEMNTSPGRPAVALQVGATTFDALLPDDGRTIDLVRDSRVEVTGIVVPATAPFHPFHLWVRDWADVNVLEVPPPPPWWTPTRVCLVFGGLALGAAVWVGTLRLRIWQQTAELRTHFEKEAQLEAQLRQSQKLEAIGRLAGGIAHDFNNLLTVINGCSDLLKQDLPPAGPEADLLGAISSAGERAAGLTKQLLLFSRRRAVTLGPLDLNEALADAEKLLRRVIGEHIELVVSGSAGLPLIRADADLIHQVLLNLAVNARDAMPEQGRLVIAAESSPDGKVRLTVTDTGCGMDDATQARLFEPFFTTKEVGKGTGLGLACVYGIVQTLDGEIRVHSALGQGTSFEIDFPALAAADAPALAPPREAAPAAVRLKDMIVLVVEDEPAVRDMVRRVLADKVSRLLVAAGPGEALRLARARATPIHVLLTDIVMPEMNGRILAEKLRRLYPELAVLFMSGYASDDVLRDGPQGEGAALLQKPFTADVLLAKLGDVVRAHTQRERVRPA